MIRLPETGPVLGRCRCGRLVTDDFRDALSRAEAQISGMCAACIDAVFLALDEEGVLPPQLLRYGALAVHRTSGGEIVEVVLLPFVAAPVLHKIAWNTQHIVRIGYALPPPSHAEYEALDVLLEAPNVSVTDVASFTDPCLAWLSDLAVLFGSDSPSLDAIAKMCPVLGTALRVPLSDHLSPFATSFQMASALLGSSPDPHCAPHTPAWRLLESLRAHFPDSSSESRS